MRGQHPDRLAAAYAAHAPYASRVAKRWFGRHSGWLSDHEDIVQDAFTSLAAADILPEDHDGQKALVLQALRWAYRDYWRRAGEAKRDYRKHVSLEAAQENGFDAPAPVDIADLVALRDRLRAVSQELLALTEGQRLAVLRAAFGRDGVTDRKATALAYKGRARLRLVLGGAL